MSVVQRYFGLGGGSSGLGGLLASPVGLGFLSVVTLALLILGRAAVGAAFGLGMHPVTPLALIGGFVGGSVMAWIIGVGIDATGEDVLRLRVLQYVHVAYATFAGGLFPWAYRWWMGAPGQVFVEFPFALHSAHAWSMLLFAVAGGGYLAVGSIGGVGNYLRQWGAILGMYVIYGMVFGVWMRLCRPVWYVLIGLR